jgi:Ku protein
MNRETGNRLRQRMVDEETEEIVSSDEMIMGYEYEKGSYVTIEKEEIDELKIESSEVIKIERVVPSSSVDWLYWDSPYLVVPDGKTGRDIFATIRDALGDMDVVGLGRMVMARRERPVMVQTRGKGLMIVTLKDPDEVRKPEEIFDDEIKDVDVDKQAVSMAETLLKRMEGDFDLTMFEDRYQTALQALIEAKMKGQKPVVSESRDRPTNVVNLFDALKASLDNDEPAPSRKRAAPVKASSKKKTAKKTAAHSGKARKRA